MDDYERPSLCQLKQTMLYMFADAVSAELLLWVIGINLITLTNIKSCKKIFHNISFH